MRLNLTVVADQLTGFTVTASHPGDPYNFSFDSCRVWRPGDKPSPNVLYLCQSPDVPSPPPRARVGVVCIGALPAGASTDRMDYLCVSKDTDLIQLVNEVMAVFSRFDDWDRRLQDSVMAPHPLTSLAVTAREVFDNDLCCWDANGYLLTHARTPDAPAHAGYPATDAELADNDWFYIRADAVAGHGPSPVPRTVHVGVYWANSIVCDVFDETSQPTWALGSHAADKPWLSRIDLDQLSQDALLARLTLDDTIREFKPSDAALLYHVSGYFGAALLQDDTLRVGSSAAFDKMLKALVQAEKPYRPTYDAVLAESGWYRSDAYRCVVIASSRGELTQNRSARLATLIHRRLPHTYTYQLPESLLVIVNVRRTREQRLSEAAPATSKAAKPSARAAKASKASKAPGNRGDKPGSAPAQPPREPDVWDSLEPLLAAHSCCAAVSDEFRDFSAVLSYEQQAAKTLDAGRLHNPGQTLYRFETSALDLLLQNSRGGLAPERYCTSQVQTLVAYDRKHGGGLVRTLHEWLVTFGDVAEATKRLKVHKTTLYYRLRRAEQITGLSLDDHRTRLYLSILFETVPQLQKAVK